MMTLAAIGAETTRLPAIELGRSSCGDPAVALQREWVVANGIGGFASGTVGDALTRRYHGLLFAALNPPLGRTLLLAKLDATATYAGATVELATNQWASGSTAPQGYREIETFRLDGSVPTWTYAFADAVVERTIWMETGENTTFVRYAFSRGSAPLQLAVRALVNARDYHALTQAYDVHDAVTIAGRSAAVTLSKNGPVLHLGSDRCEIEPGTGWYYGFALPAECERGLDDREDHYHAVTFAVQLLPGQTMTIAASTRPGAASAADDSRRRRMNRDVWLLGRWQSARPDETEAPSWIRALVLAADQFIVDRHSSAGAGQSMIAGYPWFGDWGRDTMIALPGLALATGRCDVAKNILCTFGEFLDRGMLPNRFPDAGEAPEYNTVDATLWYVEAIRKYVESTGDEVFAERIFPTIEQIVAWHRTGTRYRIHADPADGLLYSGEDGVQLTWMDAKVGDYVVTPRTGKCVEINALWYAALVTAATFARRLGRHAEEYDALATRVRESFGKFWNPELGYCYDVIDGPAGNDPAVRPNAVIAASLAASPLTPAQRQSVVARAERELVTSRGLRTLAAWDPQYIGRYGGNQYERDRAYHQGTIWPWLLGPFVSAHYAVHGDRARALAFFAGVSDMLASDAIGTLPEIAEGDAPFAPRGCFAQAWSVSEVLRAWHDLHAPWTSGASQ